MPATKRPAPRKPARKRTPAKRRPVARKAVARRPRGGSLPQRMAVWLAHFIARQAEGRRATVRTRKDAAILRATHSGCVKCHGTGTIYTKKKDGSFSGSKPCTAKPATTQVSRAAVAKAARFGPDKRSGLIGWRCPCGKAEKPRYRDAKVATKALRTHERQRHGGQTIGGTWYAQLPETAKPATTPVKTTAPITKPDTHTTMTDTEWEKQNKPPSAARAAKEGLCRFCTSGAQYSSFGGERITAVCGICHGTGKTTQPATSS
jgi:hypothetical protein